ncbi:YlcG family protein, partial [Escherichia coli]
PVYLFLREFSLQDFRGGSVLTDYRILRNYAKTLTGAGV